MPKVANRPDLDTPLSRDEFVRETIRLLAGQGKKSHMVKDGITLCRYRGAGGCCCALGFWIRDDKYSESLEGECPVDSVAVLDALPSWVVAFGGSFLGSVQEDLHDLRDDDEFTVEALTEEAVRCRLLPNPSEGGAS